MEKSSNVHRRIRDRGLMKIDVTCLAEWQGRLRSISATPEGVAIWKKRRRKAVAQSERSEPARDKSAALRCEKSRVRREAILMLPTIVGLALGPQAKSQAEKVTP